MYAQPGTIMKDLQYKYQQQGKRNSKHGTSRSGFVLPNATATSTSLDQLTATSLDQFKARLQQ